MKKGLQKEMGIGPLVSSQERRAFAVPHINRGSTAGFVPPSIPGDAVHEKGFKLQIGLGTLVSSQGIRAAAAQRMNLG